MDLTFRDSHFAHNSLWGDNVRVMTTPHDGRCYFCTEFPGVDATKYPGLGGEVFRVIKGCFRRQRVILVITDSEAYDIVPNDSPRSPGCGVGTVIGHGSSGLSRAGFWRRRVLQSGFEIP